MFNTTKSEPLPYHKIAFALALFLFTGCVSQKPLQAISETERGNVHLLDVTKYNSVAYSSTASRTTRELGAAGTLTDFVVTSIVADSLDAPGRNWVQSIRKEDGYFERGLVENACQSALRKIQPTTNGQTTTFELTIQSCGISEVQRGWFGPTLCVAAELKNVTGKKIWSAEAASVGTRLHQKQEFDSNPKLYREDFQEVADDVAHQLIEGPLR